MRRALPLALALSTPFLMAQSPALQDDGRLDPAWFGPEVKLAPGLQLDYVWIKPGTSLKGKRLQIAPWTYGALLDPKTDARDQISSGYFTERMPRVIEQYFRSLWGGGVEVGAEPGDYKLVGRVVDTSIQSMGGRFWMGMMAAQSFTWDLKILDAEGKVVVASHKRRTFASDGVGRRAAFAQTEDLEHRHRVALAFKDHRLALPERDAADDPARYAGRSRRRARCRCRDGLPSRAGVPDQLAAPQRRARDRAPDRAADRDGKCAADPRRGRRRRGCGQGGTVRRLRPDRDP